MVRPTMLLIQGDHSSGSQDKSIHQKGSGENADFRDPLTYNKTETRLTCPKFYNELHCLYLILLNIYILNLVLLLSEVHRTRNLLLVDSPGCSWSFASACGL